MMIDSVLLHHLHTAKLQDLRDLATKHEISRQGNLEILRARLISNLVLTGVDLSWEGIQEMSNADLGEVLKVLGVKSSGAQKMRRRRLWLHLNHDPKKLTVDSLGEMTRDDLHEMCIRLELARSGNKNQLLVRVAGVLTAQEGGWGRIKKSLKRAAAPVVEANIEAAAVTHDDVEAAEAYVEAVEEHVASNEPEAIAEEERVVESIEIPEEEPEEADSSPTPTTLDEGAGTALLTLESRRAELHALIRDFLLLSDIPSPGDITAFVEDLGSHGFGVQHESVREAVLADIERMAARKADERDAQAVIPGTWRERRALRRLEEVRAGLLDSLEAILADTEGDLALARTRFEQAAAKSGLDLDLPAISGRVHGLFDLQVSLREVEADADPVAHRRERAIRVLFRQVDALDASARRTLERIEQQIESIERVIETVIRRNEGRFDSLEQALFIRFLERRGWDANHPEVRPRLIAAAGILATHMGYLEPDEAPTLPSQLALDPDRVGDVVENLRDVLSEFGRAPTEEEALKTPEERAADAEQPSVDRARRGLDAADSVLSRLQRMTE